MKRPRQCEEVRALLFAYRSGEVTPLQRERVERHMAGCPACRMGLDLTEILERTARGGPAPLSDARKREILGEIHERLAAGEGSAPLAWLRRPRFFLPAGGLAVAAAAAMILLSRPESLPEQVGWLDAPGGIEAYVPERAPVALERTPDGPELRLEAHAVLVRFHRLPEQPPLRVRTPFGDALIRGTVFFVDVGKDATVVGVQQGTVEVIGGGDEHRLVGPGEEARLDAAGAHLEGASSERFTELRRLFPPPAPQAPTLATIRRPPSRPPRRPAPATPAREPDPNVIGRVVGRFLPRFQACYERGLKNHPDLRGRLVAELTYGPDGAIVEGRYLEDGLGVPEVTDCLRDVLLELTFPPGEGEVTVQIPLVFTLSGVHQG